MREIRRTIERVDVPPEIAALIIESLLFPKNVMTRPLLRNALANQFLRCTIRSRHQIRVPFIFDLQMLAEVVHQQSARFARNA